MQYGTLNMYATNADGIYYVQGEVGIPHQCMPN